MPSTSFPKKKKQVARWCTNTPTLLVNTGANTAYAVTVKANNIVNPTTTDTHEPLGYTQMSAIYDQHTVTGSRIRVDYFMNEQMGAEASNSVESAIIGIALLDDTTKLGTAGHYQELDNCIWTTLGPEGHGRLNYSCNPAKFFGIPKSQILSEDTLRSVGGTDPTNTVHYHIFAYKMDSDATDAFNIDLTVTIEYDVIWQEPKALAQS